MPILWPHLNPTECELHVSESPRWLVTTQTTESYPHFTPLPILHQTPASDSAGLRQGLKISISNKLRNDADVIPPKTPWRTSDFHC